MHGSTKASTVKKSLKNRLLPAHLFGTRANGRLPARDNGALLFIDILITVLDHLSKSGKSLNKGRRIFCQKDRVELRQR